MTIDRVCWRYLQGISLLHRLPVLDLYAIELLVLDDRLGSVMYLHDRPILVSEPVVVSGFP